MSSCEPHGGCSSGHGYDAPARMQLTPREVEKLLIHVAADVARRRRERGVKLNYPESIALIADAMLEAARDGRSAAHAMALGRRGPGPEGGDGRGPPPRPTRTGQATVPAPPKR